MLPLEDSTLIIGNRNYSGWSMRAWLTLRKGGMVFDTICLPLTTEKFKSEIQTLSPSGKVPVLHHNGTVVWDSLSISEYVNEVTGNKLWPSSLRDRCRARSIASEIHSGFVSIRKNLPFNCRVSDRHIILTDDIKNNIRRIEDIFDEIEFYTSDSWLFGEFSIADAMLIPIALRLYTYNIPVSKKLERYIELSLIDLDVQEWIQLSLKETEVLESEEIGY